MEVRAGAAAAKSDVADDVSTVYLLSRNHCEVCQVPVARGNSVSMVNRDFASVSAHEIGEHHNTIGSSDHRLAVTG